MKKQGQTTFFPARGRRLVEKRGLSLILVSYALYDSLKKIDREIAKYPPDKKQSAVMSALIIAQTKRAGCRARFGLRRPLPRHAPVAVYEVATFYAMYNLEPIGTYN